MKGLLRRSSGAILAALVLSACAEGGFSRSEVTEVNGFDVRVTQINGDPPTYRAAGSRAQDRERLDNAYYSRNIIGIRKVSGCPIKPELISHEADGPNSTATVIC